MKIHRSRAWAVASSLAVLCALTVNAFGQAGPPRAGGPPPGGLPPGAGGPPPGGAAGGPPPPPQGAGPEQGARQLTLDEVVIQTGAASMARGAPAPTAPQSYAGPFGGPPGGGDENYFGAVNGDVPEGVTPLERDIFTTTDFYADKDLWTDKRYYRCASPGALESFWESAPLQVGDTPVPLPGDNFPQSAAWGQCDVDYPLEDIFSPYPFETAQAQYEALMAEAQSRGGPTEHTAQTLPDWNGVYTRVGFRGKAPVFAAINLGWNRGNVIQASTYLSILTPEYQQYFVQQEYHDAQNEIVWPGAYCWPEGFVRRWFEPDKWVMMVPELVQFRSRLSETLMTEVMVGRDFDGEGAVPNLSGDLRQWFGDTVGFWDGDILVTWTSNIKSWIAHGWFEWSDEMQSVEIYTPITDKDGSFVGINHEAVLYDPRAMVKPVRIVENWEKSRELNVGTPFDWRECAQTLYPIDGVQMPVNPGDTIDYTVPDFNNRPWAQIWETYFEEGMTRPEGPDVLAGFN